MQEIQTLLQTNLRAVAEAQGQTVWYCEVFTYNLTSKASDRWWSSGFGSFCWFRDPVSFFIFFFLGGGGGGWGAPA